MSEEGGVLDSFSLKEAHEKFRKALDVEAGPTPGPKVQLGYFDWGEPLPVRFIFSYSYSQKQLQGILGAATALCMSMEPLRLGDGIAAELVFKVRTTSLRP